MISRLLPLLLYALLFLACQPALAAEDGAATKPKKDIYVWTDEQGVVHMRDKKPEHMGDEMTRMEKREEFFKKHPEARKKAEELLSEGTDETGQMPDDYVPYEAPPEHSQQPGQEVQPWQPGSEFGQRPQLSPTQMLLAMGVPLLIGLLFYVATSFILYRIGRKFGVGSFLGFLVPIWNVVLLCRCAGLTGWFVLFLFVPVINLFVTFLIWGKIAERLGKNLVLWGLLCTLLGLPIIILAFDSSQPVDMRRPSGAPPEEERNVYI